ncbi:hypothetical protein LTR04_006744, partial [Oleoguttula sp. CCFEE 6159]
GRGGRASLDEAAAPYSATFAAKVIAASASITSSFINILGFSESFIRNQAGQVKLSSY